MRFGRKSFSGYKLKSFLTLGFVGIMLIQIIPTTSENFEYNSIYLQEALSPEPQNQTNTDSFYISEEDYMQAEISVSIGYNLTSGLEITIGVECASLEGIGGKGSSESFNSFTGLSSVAFQRTHLLCNNNMTDSHVLKNQKVIEKSTGTSNLTTIFALVHDLGFTKEDLNIKPDLRHWFITINDTNVYEPPTNESEEFSRPVGWIESFNVTIGNTRFSSLLHPVFAAGFEVTAYISGQACEIFHKSSSSQPGAGGGASVNYHWHWVRGTKLYGVAGVVGIAYFDEWWRDLTGIYDEQTGDGEAPYILETLRRTGIWEIYYMVTLDESDDIDDSDIVYLLGTLVNDAIGNPPTVEHCFWWVATHGWFVAGEQPREGLLISSNSGPPPYWIDDSVTETKLAEMMDVITSKGVWLFYWMPNCQGQEFNKLWEEAGYHNNKALFWYYYSSSYCKKVCQYALRDHITYGQKSAQWMFGEGKTTHRYWYFDGVYLYDDVDFIKYTYGQQLDPDPDDMRQADTMNGYEFCFVPNSNNWIPTCRTRGAPSEEVIEPSKWESEVTPYMLYAGEKSPGTFDRYVGFYKQVYIPSSAVGGNSLYIELQGRAKSGYITVTNMYVMIYSVDWQQCIDYGAVVSGGTYDSGWLDWSDTLYAPCGETYNVFICFSDAWSYDCWYQKIYAKNIYIGNAAAVRNPENFEDGDKNGWDIYYSQASSPYFDVHSSAARYGTYGARLYMLDSSGDKRVSCKWTALGRQDIGKNLGPYGKYYSFWTYKPTGYTYGWHDFYPVCDFATNSYIKVRFYYKYLQVYNRYNGGVEQKIYEVNIYNQDGRYWTSIWHQVDIHLWWVEASEDWLVMRVRRKTTASSTIYDSGSIVVEWNPYPPSPTTLYSGYVVVACRGGWSAGNYGKAYWDDIRVSTTPALW